MARHRNGLLRRLWWCPLRVSQINRFDTIQDHLEFILLTCFHRYDTGTISGIMAMPYWKDLFSTGYRNASGDLDITTSQESAIVSILSAGTFFGALASPLLSDYFGRRPALMISTWVFNLGVVLQTIATAIPMFLAGRFFAGFGVGLISALSKSSSLSSSLTNFSLPFQPSSPFL